MIEGFWQRADDFEAMFLPEMYRGFIGRDDGIELHGLEAEHHSADSGLEAAYNQGQSKKACRRVALQKPNGTAYRTYIVDTVTIKLPFSWLPFSCLPFSPP